MEIIQGFILGLVQGLTEFLPVSSSGHLTLLQNIFGLKEANQSFTIILHVATLIAVFAYYWEDILALIIRPFQRTTALLVAGTVPTVIIALLFNDKFDAIFGSGKFLGFNFIFTGLVLLYADSLKEGKKKVKNMSVFDSLVVGFLQGVAILPAVSRSGMTVAGSMSRGLDKESAAKFSFLLSIPAILGGMVLTIKDVVKGEVDLGASIGIMPMIVGFFAAMISGYFAIRFMVGLIKNSKLKYFSGYVFVLGLVLIVDQFFIHMIIK